MVSKTYTALLGAFVAMSGASAQTLVDGDPAKAVTDAGNACYQNKAPVAGEVDYPCNMEPRIAKFCELPPLAEGKKEYTQEQLKEHQKCLCDGSYFDDAVSCVKCKEVNALLTDIERDINNNAFKEIRQDFCSASTLEGTVGAYFDKYYGKYRSMAEQEEKKTGYKGVATPRGVPAGNIDITQYYPNAKVPQGPGVQEFMGRKWMSNGVVSDAPANAPADAPADTPAEDAATPSKVDLRSRMGTECVADEMVKPQGSATTSALATTSTLAPKASGFRLPGNNATMAMPKVETRKTTVFMQAELCSCQVIGVGFMARVELVCADAKPIDTTVNRNPAPEVVETLPNISNCGCLSQVNIQVYVYQQTTVITGGTAPSGPKGLPSGPSNDKPAGPEGKVPAGPQDKTPAGPSAPNGKTGSTEKPTGSEGQTGAEEEECEIIPEESDSSVPAGPQGKTPAGPSAPNGQTGSTEKPTGSEGQTGAEEEVCEIIPEESDSSVPAGPGSEGDSPSSAPGSKADSPSSGPGSEADSPSSGPGSEADSPSSGPSSNAVSPSGPSSSGGVPSIPSRMGGSTAGPGSDRINAASPSGSGSNGAAAEECDEEDCVVSTGSTFTPPAPATGAADCVGSECVTSSGSGAGAGRVPSLLSNNTAASPAGTSELQFSSGSTAVVSFAAIAAAVLAAL
ncbi:hypothetical protein CDD81_2011 [Ophiocordyceps australis]|uniref:Uncharacterized protein n=1 Tax=Ophiocordyceps australis TaxID=1399860 RepID=A0A2C5YCZ5_9HYPO|nr:hypothetical protein CDD81_2011 [Ophiocordyceps australis]